MFSREEKIKISKAVADVLKEINHPEMDINNIHFNLHVEGKEAWSWADIHEPKPETSKGVDPNPWNEQARELLGEKDKVKAIITYKGKIKTMEAEMPTNEDELYGFLHQGDFLYSIGMEIARIMKLDYPEV